jgi:ferredoxin-type protein NapH
LGAALILLALALAGGRLFCGWICPFGFILDIIDKFLPCKKPSAPKVLPPAAHNVSFLANRNNKYGVLAGAAAASAVSGNQAFCALCPIGVVCRSYGLQNVLGGAELAVIPLIAAMDVGAKRSWCRYFCPVGAFFALPARFTPLGIEIGADCCKKFSCKRCAAVCPMGIISDAALQAGEKPVINRAECIMCLRCVDICPHKAAKLRFGFIRKTENAASANIGAPVSASSASAGGRA